MVFGFQSFAVQWFKGLRASGIWGLRLKLRLSDGGIRDKGFRLRDLLIAGSRLAVLLLWFRASGLGFRV